MDYRRMGRSGLKLSAFSLGSWVTFARQVDSSAARELMAAAYDAGINFFDNAEGYEAGASEVLMGEALAALKWRRDSYVVSSKVFWGGSLPTQRGLSRKHIHDACHATLKRLQVDYIDLFFCHRPDLDTPIEETVAAMDTLIRQGKVLYWGTSQWTGQQITEAVLAARQNHLTAPSMEQPEYNFFARHKVESDFLPVYDLAGIGTTIWSPLASGLLTGKYKAGIPAGARASLAGYEWLKNEIEGPEGQAKLAKIARLDSLASAHGLPLHHMALLWCLSNPHVSTVILGASSLGQLQDNLKALQSAGKLTAALKDEIEKILLNRPPGPQRY